jgi:hypothetical protein
LPVSALATLLLIGSAARAQVASWTGNVDNNWTNDSNWQWTGQHPRPRMLRSSTPIPVSIRCFPATPPFRH